MGEKENHLSRKYLSGPLNPEPRKYAPKETYLGQFQREKTEIPCPSSCGSDIELTCWDLVIKRKVKCIKCGSGYEFDSSDQYKLRNAMKEIEALEKEIERKQSKINEDVGDAINKLLSNADIQK